MKQVVISGTRQAIVALTDDPIPKENWVVVKVHAAPLCTEYKDYAAGRVTTYCGHEAAGEVVAVAQPGCVRVGDRVVVMPGTACGKCDLCLDGDYIHCRHNVNFEKFHGSLVGSATMAQYLLKPDWLLVPIPDDMSYEHASMACCGLGPAFAAVEGMNVTTFDTLLVTGMGPVGLGAVINAVYRGARVIAAASNPWRAQRALDLGAAHVVDPASPDVIDQISGLTRGSGVDKALDCSGAVAAHRLCIDATRRLGQVGFIGESSAETPIRVSPDLIRKGLSVHGFWHYNLRHTPKMMQMISEVAPQLDRLISHTFPIDRVADAFETQLAGQSAKVILKPW